MSLNRNNTVCISDCTSFLPLQCAQLRITIVPGDTDSAGQVESDSANMFGIPGFRLERVPAGNRRIEPGWTYVVSRGRGRNKKMFFVRKKAGRGRGRQPPVIYIDDPEPPPQYVPRHIDDPGRGPRCGCQRCREGYVYGCLHRLYSRREPSFEECHGHGYHRGGRLETILEEQRPFGGPENGGHHSPIASPRAAERNHVGTQTAASPTGRHVHWVDGRDDGSLSPVPSLGSCSSVDSDDGGVACPRTPSSSPERRSCRPTIIEREPRRSCGCDEACGHERSMFGGIPRYGFGRSSHTWRDAPCWDDDLGVGVVREPRF
jgi:hypothetical protein